MVESARRERRARLAPAESGTGPSMRPRAGWTRAERILLALLACFTLSAIGGYAFFALHPDRIPESSAARAVFGHAFPFFAQGHILLSAVVLVVPLARRAGRRWLWASAGAFLLSLLSEFIGTTYGIPFGGYEYTALLGPKIGGRVPWLIPLSWSLMALPSYGMAKHVFESSDAAVSRILLGAYLLTAWDLALDPAMSHLTPYWIWEVQGPYYGMPWVNLVGWFGTGLFIMAFLERTGAQEWVRKMDVGWLALYYGLLLLMPVGMLAAAGLWTAVALTLGALGAAWALYRIRGEAAGATDGAAWAGGPA